MKTKKAGTGKTVGKVAGKAVGVVVGRFQTPYLHDGHAFIIDTASGGQDNISRELFIVIGVSNGSLGIHNPLDFETRKAMIYEKYPEAVIAQIDDHPSDEAWSRQLDALIERHFPDHDALLFGSRDSFLPHYSGKHQTKEVPSQIKTCATDLRTAAVADKKAKRSRLFRQGVMYACAKQVYPTSFQAVDVVIAHSTEKKVLVGRKPGQDGWRFPGGFVDPKDESLERAAQREAIEEVGDIEIADVKYLRSVRIADYRYRKSEHAIMTALFTATYVFGRIKAGDDLEEVRWQHIDGLIDCLVPEHKALAKAYIESK